MDTEPAGEPGSPTDPSGRPSEDHGPQDRSADAPSREPSPGNQPGRFGGGGYSTAYSSQPSLYGEQEEIRDYDETEEGDDHPPGPPQGENDPAMKCE